MGPGFLIAESRDDLAIVAEEWRALAESEANAFLTPEWFDASLATYGDSATPFVAILRGQGEAVEAIAPLVREGEGARAAIRFAGSSLGDLFFPAAIDESKRNELSEKLGKELVRRRDWGALVLENVPEDAAWVDAFSAAGLKATRLPHRDEVLPRASMGGIDWDGFLAARSRNFRSQLGRKQRGLERDHDVVYRLVSKEEELSGALDSFERLHHARWDARGGSQALTERSREFHARFARAALERGWLRLWLLEVDSEAVAAWYGWRVGGSYAYYLAGFDPSWSRRSVGLLLQAQTVRAAIEEGAATYDLLLGGEEYKARFADGEDRVCTYTVARKLSKARMLAQAEVLARSGADRLSPELRAKLKERVGGLARRAPSDVKR
jgi:CelD/BcsL family acetyltransferase involved in cellulose biosynthesis